MTAPTEGLMKLIGLTKQKRDVGPMLQEYVRKRYGVENMAAFTRGEVAGVADKEALYRQWIDWIEAGEMHRFMDDESDEDDDFLAALLEDVEAPEMPPVVQADNVIYQPVQSEDLQEDDVPVLSDEPEAAVELAEEAYLQVEPTSGVLPDELENPADVAQPEASVESGSHSMQPVAQPVAQPATQPAMQAGVDMAGSSGSLDTLVLEMIRQELQAQVKPDDSLSEERVREIVREELRAMLKAVMS